MVLMVYPESCRICMIYVLLLLYLCVCMYPHITEVKRVHGFHKQFTEQKKLPVQLNEVPGRGALADVVDVQM